VNSRRFEEEKPCSKCRLAESQAGQLKEELRQTEQQIEKLLIENESLQEYIFDIEQKIVGVDLEVERRLKEKSKPERRISPIREDNKEVVEQLESEIAVLQ
jgi:predicted RNase H-like nuclease (RuvC/YqgF family)